MTDGKRNKAPSRAIVSAGAIGAPIAAGLGWLASYLGWSVAPEVAAALGTIISAAIGYATRGGRQGEPY